MQLKDNKKQLRKKIRFQLVSYFRTWLCLKYRVNHICNNRKASLCAHYFSRSLVLLTILTFNHGIYRWAVVFPLFFEGERCYIQFKCLHQVVNSCQYYTRGLYVNGHLAEIDQEALDIENQFSTICLRVNFCSVSRRACRSLNILNFKLSSSPVHCRWYSQSDWPWPEVIQRFSCSTRACACMRYSSVRLGTRGQCRSRKPGRPFVRTSRPCAWLRMRDGDSVGRLWLQPKHAGCKLVR